MKPERALKKYYEEKIRAAGPIPLPGRYAVSGRSVGSSNVWRSDLAVGFAVHIVLAVFVAAGLAGFGHESRLGGLISRRAQDVSLDSRIEAGIGRLNGYILLLRKDQ